MQSWFLAIALSAGLFLPTLAHAQTNWVGAIGDWSIGVNWDAGVPTAGVVARINNGGNAEVTTPGNASQTLNVASGAGVSGTLQVTGAGRLQTVGIQLGNGIGSNGTLTIATGGQMTQAFGSSLQAGTSDATATATVTGAGSHLDWTGGGTVVFGSSGTATLNLTNGGQFTFTTATVGAAGGTGTINVGTGGLAGILSANVTTGSGTGTVNFNHTDDVTYANVISSGTVVTKAAAGTLILSGANTYTGGTTVSGGILEGTTTSLQGNIVNNAAVRFNQVAAGTYSGVISGTGTLTKIGAGTLTVSGTHTYSGGTTVTAGALEGTTTSLQGNIANNAAVSFNQTTTGTYAGVMSGTGTLTKAGSGTVTLSAVNTYNGASTVQAGTLLVTGTLASAVSLTGGTVGGTGTIQALTATGGTVAPGVSPGILNTGSLNFNGATTMFVELNGATAGAGHDQLNVTGTVTLGNAALSGSVGFLPASGTTLTIINNDGADAVTGTFSGLAQGAVVTIGGRTFTVSYTGGSGNDVVLTALDGVSVTGTLPDLIVGTPVSVTFGGAGGSGGPYTVAVTAGALPAGLSLSAGGVLSGTPTAGGSFSFTLTVTDAAAQTGSIVLSGTVAVGVPTLPPAGLLILGALLMAAAMWHRRRQPLTPA